MVAHHIGLSAFTPSLGFISASILMRNVLQVWIWIMPCIPLLGEPFSVVPEALCRVLDLFMGLIVHGKYKPLWSWPYQTQDIITLGVGQLTLPLMALVLSPIHIGIHMRSVVELDTVELHHIWRWVGQCLNNPSKLSESYITNHDYWFSDMWWEDTYLVDIMNYIRSIYTH